MRTEEIFQEYARVLRLFYCNPSDPQVRLAVSQFELTYGKFLMLFWKDWQKLPSDTFVGDPFSLERHCDDCLVPTQDLITKGNHHGGQKTVCRDRDACHRRSPG